MFNFCACQTQTKEILDKIEILQRNNYWIGTNDEAVNSFYRNVILDAIGKNKEMKDYNIPKYIIDLIWSFLIDKNDADSKILMYYSYIEHELYPKVINPSNYVLVTNTYFALVLIFYLLNVACIIIEFVEWINSMTIINNKSYYQDINNKNIYHKLTATDGYFVLGLAYFFNNPILLKHFWHLLMIFGKAKVT